MQNVKGTAMHAPAADASTAAALLSLRLPSGCSRVMECRMHEHDDGHGVEQIRDVDIILGRTLVIPLSGDRPQCQRCET